MRMISADIAYLESKNTECDMNIVETELKNIDEMIRESIKQIGVRSIKYKIDLEVSERKLFATYAEILNCLRDHHYYVSLQTENYLAEDGTEKCGTYIYIDWDMWKENR